MQEIVARFMASLAELPDFADVDIADINACGTDGDTALHVALHRNDLSIARALVEDGIDINKAGDLGYTALHVACMKGNADMVHLLIENGADLFALNEGDPPFTSARLAGHDHICDLLGPLMKKVQSSDPNIWVRARIGQLQREIASLEAKLKS